MTSSRHEANPSIKAMAMKKLDDSTLRAVTTLVYGADRSVDWGWQDSGVPGFLRRAGVTVEDCIPSVSSREFLAYLRQLNEGTFEGLVHPHLEAILRRIADPKEHQGNDRVRRQALKRLNDLLRPEGLEMVLDGVTPVLREIEPSLPNDRIPTPEPVPAPGFSSLVKDEELVKVLIARWDEVQKCMRAEAYLSAVIMMGSILECVLLAKAKANPQKANDAMKASDEIKDKSKSIDKWGLFELIVVSHSLGWIKKPMKDFSGHIREYRNLVHPAKQLEGKLEINRRICNLCWLVTEEVVSDIVAIE